MKKIFLFAFGLIASIAMQAQMQWFSAIEMSNATNAGTSTINHVYSNAQGDIFFVGTAASNGTNPKVWFREDTVEAAPYRVNQSKTNSNLVFGKQSAKAETPNWFGASNRGNFGSFAAIANDKGELVMAVTACHSDSNYLADNKIMQMSLLTNTGVLSKNDIEGAYSVVGNKIVNYGALIVVGSDAWITPQQAFAQMAGQADGFKFVDVATDGTNYYVLTLLTPGLVVDKDTIKAAHYGGSIAVLKFGSNWKLAGYCISEGTAGKNIGNLRYVGGKLYYSGNLTATKGGSFGIGGKTIETANAGNGIVLATLDSDLKCESLNLIESCAVGKKSGAITIYDEVVDGTNAYLTGFFSGGIVIAEGDTMSAANTSAVLIKYDLNEGKIAQATHLESAGITGGSSLIAHGDSIYMYAYDWGSANRVSLYGFDKELNAGDTIALVEAAGQEVSNSATLTEKGTLAYSFRTKDAITFAADESKTYTTSDGKFRGILAVQSLFEEPETAIDNTLQPTEKAVKFIQNGQLYIRRGEQIFNALGQQL